MDDLEPEQPGKRPVEVEDEDEDFPSLKRKKTVTWADGEDPVDGLDSDDNDDLEVDTQPGAPVNAEPFFSDQQPVDTSNTGVVTVLNASSDPLFAGLDRSALEEQDPLPKNEEDTLTHAEVLERRLGFYDQLAEHFEEQLWDVADEMLLRRWHLLGTNPEACPPIDSNTADPSVAAAALKGGMHAAWDALHRNNDHAGPSLPTPTDLETLACSIPAPSAEIIEEFRQRMVFRRGAFLRQLDATGRLETAATSASARELDSYNAVAALCGRSARFLLRRTAVVLGRGTAAGQGAVDVDLAAEGAGGERCISRQQAELFLDADGEFKVRCLGRRAMFVNGVAVSKGQVVPMPHLGLLKVGPVALLFIVNKVALDRLQKRSAALSVY